MNLKKIAQNSLEYTIAGLFTVFVVITFAQVIARYVFNAPFTWSEELARYLFVWTVMLAGGLGIQRGVHIGVDLLTEKLPARFQGAIVVINHLLMVVFLLFLSIKGFSMAMINLATPSPAMQVSLGWAYFSIPIGALVMLIFSLGKIYEVVGRKSIVGGGK
ncbi:MAG TPA: TRAP transporter small permease [Desulfosporosinus sp.]|nr:TRAP transporter small permease [Desulfosporosinus sp.]